MKKTLDENPSKALEILLHRLNTKFTSYSIRNLKKHPDYPSLLSINHTLDQLQIDNIATRTTYEQMQNEFPKPLLVHMQERGGSYRVVDKLDDDSVYFVNRKGKLLSQSRSAFMKSWSGVAMLIDSETKGVEKDYATNRVKDVFGKAALLLVIFGLLLFIVYTVTYTSTLSTTFDYLFLLTKLVGVTVTIPLMIRLIDKDNALVKQLCQSGKSGKNANCSSILDSPAATIWGVISWSEVGFIYFSTLFLYLLFFQNHVNVLIASLAVLVAPFTAYSIYYQWKIARQWCRLCLAVQVVILLELGLAVAFLSQYGINSVDLYSVLVLLVVFTIVVSIYGLLKPMLIEWKRAKKEIPQLNKIKYKPEVFQLLLRKNSPMDTSGLDAIQFGNPNGEHELTIISNPTCGPCISMHQRLFELLKKKDNISIQEILLTQRKEQSIGYQVAMHMLKLSQTAGADYQSKIEAYYLSYSQNSKGWLNEFGSTTTDTMKAKQILKKQIDWCQRWDILATPTVLYNRHVLPKEYTIEDFNYLID